MEKRGAMISEFAMGTFPGPQNFPIRNRIISGMAPRSRRGGRRAVFGILGDVIEELPTPIQAELLPVESANSEQRTVLVERALEPNERILYDLLAPDETRFVDDLVDRSGLTSSELLPSLFDLELKGVVRQLPGKQFLKVLL